MISQVFHAAILEVRDTWCMKVLTKILHRPLWEDVLKILLTSFKWSLHNLAQVLVRRSCGDPGEVLSRFLHDLVQLLVRRSCGILARPLLKVLAWRSCRCHVSEVLMWKLSLRRFLYQDLVRSSPAAAGSSWRSSGILLGVLAWRSWSRCFGTPGEKLL